MFPYHFPFNARLCFGRMLKMVSFKSTWIPDCFQNSLWSSCITFANWNLLKLFLFTDALLSDVCAYWKKASLFFSSFWYFFFSSASSYTLTAHGPYSCLPSPLPLYILPSSFIGDVLFGSVDLCILLVLLFFFFFTRGVRSFWYYGSIATIFPESIHSFCNIFECYMTQTGSLPHSKIFSQNMLLFIFIQQILIEYQALFRHRRFRRKENS